MLKVFEKNGKFGFEDDGKEVVPAKYDRCEEFKNGYACIKIDGKWGVIDETGKEVVPFAYDSIDFIYGVRHGFIVAGNGDKKGLVDIATGKEVIPCEYEEVWTMDNGTARVAKKMGTKIDFEVSASFTSISKENIQYGIVKIETGEEVVPCKYDQIDTTFKNGFAVVENDGKQGVINSEFKEIVPCEYEQICDLKNGFFRAKQKDLWNFLDKDGNQATFQGFDYLEDCQNGYALAKKYRTDLMDGRSKTEWIIIKDNGATTRGYWQGEGWKEFEVMEILKDLRSVWNDEQERLKNEDGNIKTI